MLWESSTFTHHSHSTYHLTTLTLFTILTPHTTHITPPHHSLTSPIIYPNLSLHHLHPSLHPPLCPLVFHCINSTPHIIHHFHIHSPNTSHCIISIQCSITQPLKHLPHLSHHSPLSHCLPHLSHHSHIAYHISLITHHSHIAYHISLIHSPGRFQGGCDGAGEVREEDLGVGREQCHLGGP